MLGALFHQIGKGRPKIPHRCESERGASKQAPQSWTEPVMSNLHGVTASLMESIKPERSASCTSIQAREEEEK